MTTEEKLAEVEREFAQEGYEVKAVVVESLSTYGCINCNQCGKGRSIYVRVDGTPPHPKQPTSESAKALEKHAREYTKWLNSIFHLTVCPDRLACRLRAAKRAYRTARREEKARRRCERALRV